MLFIGFIATPGGVGANRMMIFFLAATYFPLATWYAVVTFKNL